MRRTQVGRGGRARGRGARAWRSVGALVLAGAALAGAGPAADAQPQPPDFGATILVNQGLRLVARQGVDNDATVSAPATAAPARATSTPATSRA